MMLHPLFIKARDIPVAPPLPPPVQEEMKDTANNIFEKKTFLGLGPIISISNFGHEENRTGANLKFDADITHRANIGFRASFQMISKKRDESYQMGYEKYHYDFKGGYMLNVMPATVLYGKNSSQDERVGFYISVACGYSHRKASENFEYTLIDALTGDIVDYAKYTMVSKINSFSGQLILGGEINLGQGRIYFDSGLLIPIYGRGESKYYDVTEASFIKLGDWQDRNFSGGYGDVLFNIGYQFYL